MSVTSNIHTAIVYESKGKNKTQAQDGQRLVVTIAKADKNGNYGEHLQQTMATSIPKLTDDAIVDAMNQDDVQVRLLPHFVSYLETVQNALIASQLKEGRKEVTTEQLEIPALLNYLDAEKVGDRWDAERIAAWFEGNMAEHIGVALIEKGFDDAKMEVALGKYSKLFSETFAGRGMIARKKAEEINKALKLAPATDPVVARFQARVNKALEEVSIAEELGL